jgi:hypothetical protein
MYVNRFGTHNQVCFDAEADYYEFLGYLAKNDGTTKLVWENNDEQGAWTAEGRIHFYITPPVVLRARLHHTAGVGSIVSRVNCNDFVQHIARCHNFISNDYQNVVIIRVSIPPMHITDFERGLAL